MPSTTRNRDVHDPIGQVLIQRARQLVHEEFSQSRIYPSEPFWERPPETWWEGYEPFKPTITSGDKCVWCGDYRPQAALYNIWYASMWRRICQNLDACDLRRTYR